MNKRNRYIVFFLIISFLLSVNLNAQGLKKHFKELPKKFKSSEKQQKYLVTIEWKNRDLDGNLFNHYSVQAKYTKGLENDYVIWNDVEMTEFKDTIAMVNALPELDNLTYKIEGDNFTKEEFYKNFPQQNLDLIRWFVQDAVGIETYGLMFFDSLKFNQVLYPDFFKNQKADFENYVNFNTRELSLCWTGISERNDEICALIHYQGMYNPVDSDTEAMKINGRSCFWGDVYVSYEDKDIEYATMYEDLVFKIFISANNFEQRMNLQRNVKFEKIP